MRKAEIIKRGGRKKRERVRRHGKVRRIAGMKERKKEERKN